MPYSDPQKQKECQQRWNAEHPEKLQEYSRKAEESEKTKAYRKAYRESEAGQASLKRRQEKYRGSEKALARYRRANALTGRNRYYKFEHGITEAEFEAQIAAQNNLCPIGNHPFGERGKKADSPCQDHDHETGENREILCRNHNVMLGLANDNPEILVIAISYLQKYKK